jgi:hypothetical protein
VAKPALSVVCSWCTRVITHGTPLALVTHTICAPCIDRMMSAQTPESHPSADYFGDFFDQARRRVRES